MANAVDIYASTRIVALKRLGYELYVCKWQPEVNEYVYRIYLEKKTESDIRKSIYNVHSEIAKVLGMSSDEYRSYLIKYNGWNRVSNMGMCFKSYNDAKECIKTLCCAHRIGEKRRGKRS